MPATIGTIVEANGRGMFAVACEDGTHSAWTLYSHATLAIGDKIQGRLDEMGSELLMTVVTRRQFEAFWETGPTTLDECQRLMSTR